jgi:hypothetical protein
MPWICFPDVMLALIPRCKSKIPNITRFPFSRFLDVFFVDPQPQPATSLRLHLSLMLFSSFPSPFILILRLLLKVLLNLVLPQSSSISFHLPPRAFQQSSFYSSLGALSASPFRSPANTPQFSTYTTSFTPTRNGFSEPLGGEQRRQRLWKVLKSGWTSKSCRRCCGCANYSPCCGSRYCASLFSRSCCHWCHEDCSEPFCTLVTVGGGALVITVWVFSRRMRTDPREP